MGGGTLAHGWAAPSVLDGWRRVGGLVAALGREAALSLADGRLRHRSPVAGGALAHGWVAPSLLDGRQRVGRRTATLGMEADGRRRYAGRIESGASAW
jgi:hypothetical protein